MAHARMADQARRCIEAMDGRRQDFTMLWWLKRPRWLTLFKAGTDLLDWVTNKMAVPERVFRESGFQREVFRTFKERGIRPIAPDRVVDNWNKNKAKELCLEQKWPKPFFPVMLQTRPREGQQGAGAFIVFSSWQDAIIALQTMAKTKRYKGADRNYPATMVYENQVADMQGYDYPCRIILDCDAKMSQFGGRFTLAQLGEAISRVPAWFSKRMVEIGAIKSTDLVLVYEKEKSRVSTDAKEGKASKHYVFNIAGLSTWDTQAVLREIFGKEIEREKAEKQKACLPQPWHVTDPVPHHGRGQYSVLGFFDVEKGETECPGLTRCFKIMDGQLVEGEENPKPCKLERGECTLEHPLALQMLHRACYSCPAKDFITIDPKFMVQRQVAAEPTPPAASLELTRTPDGGRQKIGGPAVAPALDHPAPTVEAKNRRSCRSGSSQRFPGSRAGAAGIMTSTPA